MALRDEIQAKFDKAAKTISSATTPPGVMRRDDEPDPRLVAINANFEAIAESLMLLAEEIDALKAK